MTFNPDSCNALPMMRATFPEPTISNPVAGGSLTPNQCAIVFAVALCIMTVPMMIKKVSGTSKDAPG